MLKQPSLFGTPEYEINNEIYLIELFGGVGSQAMALRDMGAKFKHHRLVEFDKYCVQSYNAIHHTDFKPTDIRDVKGSDLGIDEPDKYTYLMTYSFPCQDLSVAGKMRGMSKGSGTRSGLLWEVERLLNETENLPQVLLMENVPQVISEKNMSDFSDWLSFLSRKGYSNFYQILNATQFNVAQNRERCFMISLLGDYEYEFPDGVQLEKKITDYLEDDVDEKFYVVSDKAKKLILELSQKMKIDTGVIAENEKNYPCDFTVNSPEFKETANCIISTYPSHGITNFKSEGNGVLVKNGI